LVFVNHSISRRSVVLGAPASLLGAKTSGIRVACQTNAWPVDSRDFESVIRALASIKELGFEGFEADLSHVRGQFERGSATYDRIRKTGLKFAGISIELKKYDPQTFIPSGGLLEQAADGGKALGAERLIVSGDSTVHPLALRAKADALNRITRYCKGLGIGCAYQTQDYDFQVDGMQINGLMTMSEPGLHFVLDARTSVADFFAKNWRRVDGVRLPLGQGESDWGPLAKAVQGSQWRGWLVIAKAGEAGEVGAAREAVRRVFGV
jgi:inosose dehydratase